MQNNGVNYILRLLHILFILETFSESYIILTIGLSDFQSCVKLLRCGSLEQNIWTRPLLGQWENHGGIQLLSKRKNPWRHGLLLNKHRITLPCTTVFGVLMSVPSFRKLLIISGLGSYKCIARFKNGLSPKNHLFRKTKKLYNHHSITFHIFTGTVDPCLIIM